MVIPDITNPFMGDVARAFEAAASERGYTVLLANSAVDADRERVLIQQLLDRRVDGLLLIAVSPDEDTVGELNRSGTPVVVLDRPVPGLTASSVTVDNRAGAHRATTHLADHGHRRVACIAGPSALWPAAERERGWSDAVADLGLSRRACPLVRTRVSRRAGYEAALRLLGRAQPPTAVFVTHDEQAFGVLRAALDRGRRVPGDLAVVSFDGISQAAFAVPGLSTVRQPVDRMAERAVALLLSASDGLPTEPAQHVMPVELITRGSCGCPDTLTDDRRDP
jgi:LacI family transcriptional regulator